MADLLGELDSSPEMKKQFEDMLRGLGVEADGIPDVATAASAGLAGSPIPPSESAQTRNVGAGEGESFQETIRKTMQRMQESGESAGAAATTASQSDTDFLTSLLENMDTNGVGNEEDFSKMLMGMMEQLTNKEILYDPMKELDDKFPAWMTKNKESTPEADLKRYETQQRIVKEIVAKFEEPGYTDENVESRQYIVDRMQEMQSAGSPPADLVGEMDATTEALADMEGGCAQQ